ncbi:MAG: hypothetical protein E7677_05225 [Ruminococcaceae bacterium]|nr:hypothetical protein [Oscillospiraceae bacterium]
MDEIEKKNAIIQAVTQIECYPIVQDEVAMQEYTKVPIGELSALGATFASIAPAFQNVIQNASSSGVGEKLYKMIIPNGVHGTVNSVGNITNAGGKIVGRARFVEAGASAAGTVASINPAVMLMAVAISAVTKKLGQIEEASKDIIEFLQLKEKAVLKGNIVVLQEILDEYKFNWDNEKYKNNKHIQVQEIKRDAEQSIIFCRDQIDKKVSKKGFLHSDRDVKSKIQKVQYEFKDYELAMYIFSFSSFLEVMLLENFDAGYLDAISQKIQLYAGQYHDLHTKCYQMIEDDSKTSIEAYALKGVAGLNRALGKTIAKIPKISEGQVDENLIEAGDKVQGFSEKRTENTMELFAHEYCTCVQPFIDNINAVNVVYNEPMELLFDKDNVYFSIRSAS